MVIPSADHRRHAIMVTKERRGNAQPGIGLAPTPECVTRPILPAGVAC